MLYLSSTSNHNLASWSKIQKRLCYIFLLHQTTTNRDYAFLPKGCVISFFYIKPQLKMRISFFKNGCVISFFYIKPQLGTMPQTTWCSCVISFFCIKPQLCDDKRQAIKSCVISFFYIKPQHQGLYQD